MGRGQRRHGKACGRLSRGDCVFLDGPRQAGAGCGFLGSPCEGLRSWTHQVNRQPQLQACPFFQDLGAPLKQKGEQLETRLDSPRRAHAGWSSISLSCQLPVFKGPPVPPGLLEPCALLIRNFQRSQPGLVKGTREPFQRAVWREEHVPLPSVAHEICVHGVRQT